MEKLPPELQNQLVQLQQFQQQLEVIAQQRQILQIKLNETKHALEELRKSKQNLTIYKNAGPILIRVESKENIVKELQNDRETLEIRVKTLENQEGHLKEQASILESKLRNAITLAKGQRVAQ
jgi:prefoldin beta subunit